MPLTSVTQNPSQTAALVVAFAAGVAVGANWPKIRKSLAPLLAVTGDKFGDLYSAVAQVVGEQKESMEDTRAERRHRRRGKATPGAEQELLAGLAAALLQGKKRAPVKAARKRPAARSRKVTGPTTTPAAVDGNA
jgi:hypothetical protein